MDDTKERSLIEIAARWEAICAILDGENVSDFMLSFPEVRQIADIVEMQKQQIHIQDIKLPPGTPFQFRVRFDNKGDIVAEPVIRKPEE